jgi:hypothetical protein
MRSYASSFLTAFQSRKGVALALPQATEALLAAAYTFIIAYLTVYLPHSAIASSK